MISCSEMLTVTIIKNSLLFRKQCTELQTANQIATFKMLKLVDTKVDNISEHVRPRPL